MSSLKGIVNCKVFYNYTVKMVIILMA